MKKSPRTRPRAPIRIEIDRDALAAFDKRAVAAQLAVGVAAGWIASWFVGGSGLVRYALTGLIGSFVGGWLLEKLGVEFGFRSRVVNRIATATVGAGMVVVVARLVA